MRQMKAKRKINRRFFCRITYPLEYKWLGFEAGLRKPLFQKNINKLKNTSDFLRSTQNLKKSSSWFGCLLSKCTKLKGDCANFCVLLRKSELYLTCLHLTWGKTLKNPYQASAQSLALASSIDILLAPWPTIIMLFSWKRNIWLPLKSCSIA